MRDFHLIYDGNCGFCVKVLRLFDIVDVRGRLAFHDAQHRAATLARFPQLQDADLDDAMYAVHRGTVARGFFAFRQLMWQSPITWLLIPAFYAPGASWVGPRLYSWVASKRTAMGCGDVCSISQR